MTGTSNRNGAEGSNERERLIKAINTMLGEILPLLRRLNEIDSPELVKKAGAEGDKLLSVKEIARRMDCATATVRRNYRAGLYPFMFRHGKVMVASEKGLDNWIARHVAAR